MIRLICKFIYKLIGWKMKGDFPPPGVSKSILIVLPHTSNWDFPLGIITRAQLNADVTYLMKSSMFRPPFGWFFRWLNGIPVERSKSTNFVDAVVNLYKKNDTLHIVISPEGTRTKVEKLKTGFYYIALGAGIPIIMTRFDYGLKEVRFSPPFYPSGNKDEDFKVIYEYFKNVKGKIPENSWAYEGPED